MQKFRILTPTALKEISRLQFGRAEMRFAIEILIIFALIYLQLYLMSYLFFPLTLILIASRQHALLILMHEGAHYRLSQSRQINEAIATYIGWNFLASFHGYQRHHVFHHDLLKLNTLDDPDWKRKQNDQWNFPMKKSNFYKIILRDLFLLNTKDYYYEARDAKNNQIQSKKDFHMQCARLIYYIGLVIFLSKYELWPVWLLFWLLPIFTSLKAILRIRGVVDHFCTSSDHPLTRSRTVIGTRFEKVLFAPCSIGIHGVHHLYPSIPYYNLKKAHTQLLNYVVYQENAHVSATYWSGLNECLAR